MLKALKTLLKHLNHQPPVSTSSTFLKCWDPDHGWRLFEDWKLSNKGIWERHLVDGSKNNSIFNDCIHIMKGVGYDTATCHPHFFGKTVELGEICKSIFDFDIFWSITNIEQAKVRADAMVEFVNKNNITKREPKSEKWAANRARFSFGGKYYTLEEVR